MRWNRLINIRILLMIVFIVGSGFAVRAQDSSEILERIDAYRVPFETFLIRLKITSCIEDAVDEVGLFHAYIDGADKSLVLAKAYRTPNMKILYVEENMWVHLPGSRRPIRITPIQRLMGQASNGDVARAGYSGDYQAESIGQEKVLNEDCVKILLTAKKPSATYHKIVMHVRRSDYRPVRAEYYLLSGKHYKTARFDTFRMIDGHPILAKMTIFDEIRPGHFTIFEYEEIVEKSLPERYFNKNYLIHVTGL